MQNSVAKWANSGACHQKPNFVTEISTFSLKPLSLKWLRDAFFALVHFCVPSMLLSRPVQGYPGIWVPVDEWVSGQWNVHPGIINVPGRTPVVINISQSAVISAAVKACTFQVVAFRERPLIGSVWYRNWYMVYHFKFYRLPLYGGNPILRASLQVRQLLMGLVAFTGRSSKGVHAPSPAARASFDCPWYWRGLKGREEKGDCNLIPTSPWHRDSTFLDWVLATSDRWCHTPSTSRQWWQQSQLSITNVFVN